MPVRVHPDRRQGSAAAEHSVSSATDVDRLYADLVGTGVHRHGEFEAVRSHVGPVEVCDAGAGCLAVDQNPDSQRGRVKVAVVRPADNSHRTRDTANPVQMPVRVHPDRRSAT